MENKEEQKVNYMELSKNRGQYVLLDSFDYGSENPDEYNKEGTGIQGGMGISRLC